MRAAVACFIATEINEYRMRRASEREVSERLDELQLQLTPYLYISTSLAVPQFETPPRMALQ